MKQSQKKALAVGASVAALAAAAAGTYFFAGKRGEKNRAKVKKWVTSAQKDVTAQVAKLEKVTKQTYNNAVDTALKRYENLKDVDKSELLAIAKDLKGQWDNISSRIQKAAKPVLKQVIAKKAAPKKNTVQKTKVAAKPQAKKK